MASEFPERKETFLRFAKESKKNKILLVRTYQETISDALEATFSFGGLELEKYAFESTIEKGTDYKTALQSAMAIEENVSSLYEKVAEQAESLLATIPRVISKVAKKRRERKDILEKI
jgi:hypothetical protein